jgi:hypothetical protein
MYTCLVQPIIVIDIFVIIIIIIVIGTLLVFGRRRSTHHNRHAHAVLVLRPMTVAVLSVRLRLLVRCDIQNRTKRVIPCITFSYLEKARQTVIV